MSFKSPKPDRNRPLLLSFFRFGLFVVSLQETHISPLSPKILQFLCYLILILGRNYWVGEIKINENGRALIFSVRLRDSHRLKHCPFNLLTSHISLEFLMKDQVFDHSSTYISIFHIVFCVIVILFSWMWRV